MHALHDANPPVSPGLRPAVTLGVYWLAHPQVDSASTVTPHRTGKVRNST